MNKNHVGRRYQATGHRIKETQVDAFAAALHGEDLSSHEKGTAPAPTTTNEVPLTFAAVYCLFPTLQLIFGDSELDLHLDGLVHVEQSFTFKTPAQINDVVNSSAEIISVENKRGLTFIEIALNAQRDDAVQICHGKARLLQRDTK